MNKINQRTQSNSKLLQLLANRKSVQHLRHSQNDWPGKQRPSFASTIPLKQSRSVYQMQIATKRKAPGLPSYIKPNEIISSSKSLSLLPKTERRASQRTNFNTGNTQPLRSTNNRTKAVNVEVLSRMSSQKDEMDGYLIDYMAFNYLGKVIDNPELWTKYVHKKQGL